MLTEFSYNNAYVSGSHPQPGCRLITQKFRYNYKSFSFFTKTSARRLKTVIKKRTTDEHLRLKEKVWDNTQGNKATEDWTKIYEFGLIKIFCSCNLQRKENQLNYLQNKMLWVRK
jgi:hypothetical protein